MEAGGDELVIGRFRQQVTRDLLDGELIKRLVAVEGLHHPVAVGPHLARFVKVQAMRVTVARGIQPVAGTVLAVSGRFHEFIGKRAELNVREFFRRGVTLHQIR